MLSKIYFISGLGADKSIFQKLELGNKNQKHIDWLIPKKDESIEEYCYRLISQIDLSNEVILIGVSFGGMIAIEIAKQIKTQQVILISSAAKQKQIPSYYQWAGKLHLHKLLPTWLLKMPNPIANFFFGVENKEEKQLLATILKNTDGFFLKWAIDSIVKWNNDTSVPNCTQIHGTKDRILLFPKKNSATLPIQDGGHLMVYQRAEEISLVINNSLSK